MTGTPIASRPVVIVADNDVVLRSVLRALFARLGFDVALTAEGGTSVASVGQGRAAALVVLDLDMPGGGLASCRTLRADPSFASTPIVILTGHGDEPTRLDCLRAGATLFLTKPFNPASLLTALAPHLPLDDAGRAELAHIVEQDRGLQLRDVIASRSMTAGADVRASA